MYLLCIEISIALSFRWQKTRTTHNRAKPNVMIRDNKKASDENEPKWIWIKWNRPTDEWSIVGISIPFRIISIQFMWCVLLPLSLMLLLFFEWNKKKTPNFSELFFWQRGDLFSCRSSFSFMFVICTMHGSPSIIRPCVCSFCHVFGIRTDLWMCERTIYSSPNCRTSVNTVGL